MVGAPISLPQKPDCDLTVTWLHGLGRFVKIAFIEDVVAAEHGIRLPSTDAQVTSRSIPRRRMLRAPVRRRSCTKVAGRLLPSWTVVGALALKKANKNRKVVISECAQIDCSSPEIRRKTVTEL